MVVKKTTAVKTAKAQSTTKPAKRSAKAEGTAKKRNSVKKTGGARLIKKRVPKTLPFQTDGQLVALVDLLMQEYENRPEELKKKLCTLDLFGYTYLMHAALQGYPVACKKLLELGFQLFGPHEFVTLYLSARDGVHGWVALHCIVARGHRECLNIFLDFIKNVVTPESPFFYEAIVPREERYGWNPLMFVVNRSDFQMTQTLLQYYKAHLPEKQFFSVLAQTDLFSEKVSAYSTREDIRELIKQFEKKGISHE